MLVASSSSVKVFKTVFPCVKFRAKFKVVQEKTISLSRCESATISNIQQRSES